MSPIPDPSFRDADEHVRHADDMLREHLPQTPEPETDDDEIFPAADRDPANPIGEPGHATRNQPADDEQLASEAEVEAGLDMAEDEAHAAGEEANADDLNR